MTKHISDQKRSQGHARRSREYFKKEAERRANENSLILQRRSREHGGQKTSEYARIERGITA